VGGESWIYSYNPETKQQLSQWNSPQSPRVKEKAQKVLKSMYIFLLAYRSVHCECVPPNTTVSSDFYCDASRR
jgi:hypothetical protein